MSKINDKYVKLEIKNKKKLEQLNGGETIKVHLLAETNVSQPEFDWICEGKLVTILPKKLDQTNMGKDGVTVSRESVMLSLPSYYCSTEIEVKVVVRSGKIDIFKTVGDIFRAPNLETFVALTTPISDSIKFTPKCKAEIRGIEWRDNDGVLFGEDRPLELFSSIVAEVEVWGKNGEILQGRLDFAGETLALKAKIENNLAFFLFYTGHAHFAKALQNKESELIRFQVSYDNFRSSKTFEIKIAKESLRPILERIKSYPLQTVVTGVIHVAENNYMPCKYTQIDVEYDTDRGGKAKRKMTVFKEGSPIKPEVNIIGGKRMVTITLLNYTPKKCRLKSNSHKEKLATLRALDQNKTIHTEEKNNTGTIKDVVVEYDYGDISLIKLLFLPFEHFQYKYIRLKTCRHQNDVGICIVPDIKWEVFLELGSSSPHLYSHANMPAAYNVFEKHQKKALDASKKVKDIEVSLGLLAEYNEGEKKEFTTKIEESAKTVFQVLKIIRDALDVLSFKKNVDDNKKNLKSRNILPKNSKMPLFIEIFSPALRVGGGWQYDVTAQNQLTRKGEIGIMADPLIEAKGGIDLIACSTYIPVVGPIIEAILKVDDFAEWLTDYLSGGKAKYEGLIWFNLYLKGSLSIKGIYEFSSEEKTVSLESPTTITLVVELGLSAEVKVETVTIRGSVTHSVKAGLSGSASTGLTFKPSMGYSNKEGFYLDLEVLFNGITIEISGEAKYEETKDNKEIFSIGSETSKKHSLIEPCLIWEGKVYPFREKNDK